MVVLTHKIILDNQDSTITFTRSDDSASESSLKGETTKKTIVSDDSPTVVVDENKKNRRKTKALYHDFREEILLLRHAALEDGPLAFARQFRSTRLGVKLAVALLPFLLLLIILAVFFLVAHIHQSGKRSSSNNKSSLAASNNNNNAPLFFGEPTAVPSQIPSDLPSLVPSDLPSLVPSDLPSMVPSDVPSVLPSEKPTGTPTTSPTKFPTANPTPPPTPAPTPKPTPRPTKNPTPRPTNPPLPATTLTTNQRVTYVPGKLTVREHGLLLSEGLRCRRVARSGQPVKLNGRAPTAEGETALGDKFHYLPDGAAVFADPHSDGGWVYVSNSEVKERGQGGVGGIYFDKHGRTTDYRMLLTGTTANCSGGKTPWNTWVTCEEIENGRALQIDPFDENRDMQELTMDRGFFEAFAYDIRDQNHPRFFITEDKARGPIRRLSPSTEKLNWEDPWQLLHGPGTIEYLVLEPRGGGQGTFRWTTDKQYAKTNAAMYYPFTEGIDVYKHELFFTSKEKRALFVLNLDDKTFERQSTEAGIFDGMPDQVKRIAGDGLLYFCEEGGIENGVHARDENGWYFTVLESDTFNDESTGLAFSPDGKRMYVAFQKTGQIFDIWREDGLPFHGQTLNVRYHEFRQR